MDTGRPAGPAAQVAGTLLLTALAAAPLAYVWETLNRLFAGRVEPGRLAWSVPALAVLIAILMLIARAARRWTAQETHTQNGRGTS